MKTRGATAARARCGTAAILFAAAFMHGCGSAGGSTRAGISRPPVDSRSADLEALYFARTDSARMRFIEADVHFMTGMISHHAQALVMAGMAPTHGPVSRSLEVLTARIINAQQDEIATMQQWLRDRGQLVPEIHVEEAAPTVPGPEDDMRMPGMLTEEQMRALDRARGLAFERLFLTYMIQHHRGAVTMVDDLFATDGAASGDLVFKIASDIQVDQRTEIARMERMLEALPEAGGNP